MFISNLNELENDLITSSFHLLWHWVVFQKKISRKKKNLMF